MKEVKKMPRGITYRKDGRYMGRFNYRNESYVVYGKSVREVEQKREELKYEVLHGMFLRTSDMTVDDWWKEWIETYKKPLVKIGTIENYRKNYEKHIKPKYGKKLLADIRTTHIQKQLNELAKKYSKGVVVLVHVVWYGMFKQAVRDGIVASNPVTNTVIPKTKDKKERIVLTAVQQKRFMEIAKEEARFYPLYLMALCSGMRIGEIRALSWEDIDLGKRIIHVRHTLKYVKGIGTFLDSPKTRTSKRDIPMVEASYNLLKKLKKEQAESRMLMGKYWCPLKGLEHLVFTKRDGTPINRELVTTDINEIVKKMNDEGDDVGHVTFHSLRHMFATRAIESGMPPKVLQSILGHSTLAMTMDLYAHVMEDTMKEEMAKMEYII